MKSGIPELDEMIGLQTTGEESKEIAPKTVILIRGEPGSGKTTLGLQMLSHHAEAVHAENVLFISLEQDPSQVLKRVKESYRFFQNINIQDMLHFNRRRFDDLLRDIMKLLETNAWQKDDTVPETVVKPVKDYLSKIEEGTTPSAKAEGLLISIVVKFFAGMGKYWENDAAIRSLEQQHEEFKNIDIILFDSLDVFVEIVRKHTKSASERLIINAIYQSLVELCPKAVIIFIGEYHYWDTSKDTAISESFLCDIEISLFTEPIVVRSSPARWATTISPC
jgi:archaellum biogenesis ATPase FlaH